MIAMLADLTTVRERVQELFLVRYLAASHKLEQILRVSVRVNAAAWKRENGFNRNEIKAERH